MLTTDRVGHVHDSAVRGATRQRDVARSRPMRDRRASAARGDSVPTVVARARVDTSLEVNFRALTLPETVYVGQQANYEVAVFLNETVRDRLRRNPTFFPPDMQSMLAYDLPRARRSAAAARSARTASTRSSISARSFRSMPGRFAIPPAQLVYSLPLSASFFSREETHELRDGQHDHRRGRAADAGTPGRLRRRRRQPARRRDARHVGVARRRSDAAHRARHRAPAT